MNICLMGIILIILSLLLKPCLHFKEQRTRLDMAEPGVSFCSALSLTLPGHLLLKEAVDVYLFIHISFRVISVTNLSQGERSKPVQLGQVRKSGAKFRKRRVPYIVELCTQIISGL